MSEKENIAKSPSGRVTRTPVGRRNRLTVTNKDAGFHYRFVNDTNDNVLRYQEAGYEFVPDSKHTVGDKRVNLATSEGSIKQISVGGDTKAFLMRVPNDIYQENQKEKAHRVDLLEEDTKRTALTGTYGKLETSRS
jgi:hypothetical protein